MIFKKVLMMIVIGLILIPNVKLSANEIKVYRFNGNDYISKEDYNSCAEDFNDCYIRLVKKQELIESLHDNLVNISHLIDEEKKRSFLYGFGSGSIVTTIIIVVAVLLL